MIESEYYKKYRGPELVLAQIWTHESEKEKITDYMREFYGEDNNWNGMLYTYNEIFPERKDHKFYLNHLNQIGHMWHYLHSNEFCHLFLQVLQLFCLKELHEYLPLLRLEIFPCLCL